MKRIMKLIFLSISMFILMGIGVNIKADNYITDKSSPYANKKITLTITNIHDNYISGTTTVPKTAVSVLEPENVAHTTSDKYGNGGFTLKLKHKFNPDYDYMFNLKHKNQQEEIIPKVNQNNHKIKYYRFDSSKWKKLNQQNEYINIDSNQNAFKYLLNWLGEKNDNNDLSGVPSEKQHKNFYELKVLSESGIKEGADGNLGIYRVYKNGKVKLTPAEMKPF